MLLWWIQPIPTSCVSTFRSFHLPAVFLLLTHGCWGQSQVVGSSGPILAMLGEDTILPCHLESATDVTAKTLEWARTDLTPRFVHLRRDGEEILVNQHLSYTGRTSLSMEKLKQGDVSLKLVDVKVSDEGEYRCHIPDMVSSVVHLAVGAASSSVVIKVEVNKSTREVVLRCESAGWYPEPEVFWLDDEDNLLSAGPTEALRGQGGLFTIRSRVTVEKADNNKYLCKVQQKTFNHTRSTEIQIPDEVFMDPSCSVARIIIVMVSSIGFMLSSAILFALWKQRQRKTNKNLQLDSETDETKVKKWLIEGSQKKWDEEMAKLNKELKDKEEEYNAVRHVLEVLNEKKIELTNSIHEHRSQLETTEKKYVENEKKIYELKDKHKWNKSDKKVVLLEVKIDLSKKKEDSEKSLEYNENKLKKIDETMPIIQRFKENLDQNIKLLKAQPEEIEREKEEREDMKGEERKLSKTESDLLEDGS